MSFRLTFCPPTFGKMECARNKLHHWSAIPGSRPTRMARAKMMLSSGFQMSRAEAGRRNRPRTRMSKWPRRFRLKETPNRICLRCGNSIRKAIGSETLATRRTEMARSRTKTTKGKPTNDQCINKVIYTPSISFIILINQWFFALYYIIWLNI